MEVIGTIELPDTPQQTAAMHVTPDGGVLRTKTAVQREHLLDVYVNDILTMRLGCSASHLVELVVGRLFTEGMIAGIEDIDAISVCETSMRAYVYLADRKADLSRTAVDTVPTCCTNNRVLNDYFGGQGELAPVTPIPWRVEDVFALAADFAQDKTAHARTRGSHSAYLARGSEVLCERDDIGRHNAFDKVIGWALAQGIDLRRCAVLTSGRVPTDMVTKAIRARIPLLLSKSVATDKTIEIAWGYRLTLLTSVKPEGFDVISDPLGVASRAGNAACAAGPAASADTARSAIRPVA